MFVDQLTTDGIEGCIDEIEAAIRDALPQVTRIFIEPEGEHRSRRRATDSRRA